MHGRSDLIWRGLDRALDALCVLACISLVGLSFVAVVFRYLLNDSVIWSEEVARYLFVWIVFLGAAIGVRERQHIAIDVLGSRAGPLARSALAWLARAATLAFAALLVGPGLRFVRIGMSNSSAALQIPMGLVYLAPVVGGVLIIVYLLRAAWSDRGAPPTC